MPAIWLSAGEASGDRHAAALVQALQKLRPGLRFAGLGGPLMRKAGVEIIYDPTSISTVGFLESLRASPLLRRVLQRLGALLEQAPPALAVLVDFPGFNLRLAEMLHERQVPAVYYFPPTAWLWGAGRAQQVARTTRAVLSVLPPEVPVYEQAGARVIPVGHPVIDYVSSAPGREEARARLGIPPDAPCFALLPGSRRQEIDELLSPLLRAAALIRERLPGSHFLLPAAPSLDHEDLAGRVRRESPALVQVLPGEEWVYTVLRASDLALAASGTVTLEAACLGTPMIVIYRTSFSTYLIGRRWLHLRLIALPNLLAGREIVPELLQNQVTAENIAGLAIELYLDPERRRRMQSELAAVRAGLGAPGAVERAARAVLSVLDAGPGR